MPRHANSQGQSDPPHVVLSVGVAAIIAASLIGSAAMGARQTFGLMVEPLSVGQGFALTTVAFAIALHNLVWGFAQPFAGAAADRFGPGPVVAIGALLLSGGLALAAVASSPAMLIIGLGLMFGIGISCTSFGVVLTAIGKAAQPAHRSTAMGVASAGGSLGQVLLVPFAQGLSSTWGSTAALLGLAAFALLVVPLGYRLGSSKNDQTLTRTEAPLPARVAVLQALGDTGFCLLAIGFFTCGFQLAFIVTHLPTYLSMCGMSASTGAMALALIGLFNMIGSWGCGWLGGRFRQRNVLVWLYALRGLVILAFLAAPKTELNVAIFAAAMGMMWLGTVPLTMGVVARIFGLRHLGTLFGICFLSHQIGSFAGSWAGGLVLEATGSYSAIWIATAAAGLAAAAVHASIRDAPANPSLAPA